MTINDSTFKLPFKFTFCPLFYRKILAKVKACLNVKKPLVGVVKHSGIFNVLVFMGFNGRLQNIRLPLPPECRGLKACAINAWPTLFFWGTVFHRTWCSTDWLGQCSSRILSSSPPQHGVTDVWSCQAFMWLLGIQTEFFMLVWQGFLPSEPSPQSSLGPGAHWLGKAGYLVSPKNPPISTSPPHWCCWDYSPLPHPAFLYRLKPRFTRQALYWRLSPKSIYWLLSLVLEMESVHSKQVF